LASLGDLFVELGIDSSKFEAGINKIKSSISGVSGKLTSIGDSAKGFGANLTAGLTLPIGGAGVAAIKLASDYEESLNKVDVAFKDSSKGIKDWSNNTLTAFGIAQGTALDMAALFGDMATGMGMNTTESAKMAKSLVGLAGDLSSFKNIKIDIAETALKSIFTGETESLKELGIVMTEANLKAFALSKGMSDNISKMSESEKVQLRYAFVMEKTKNAQGDFARTQGGAANQMRIFQESMKQLGQQLGSTILPYVTKTVTWVNSLVTAFGSLSPSVKKIIVIGAGLVAVIGPLIVMFGTIASSISALLPILGAVSLPLVSIVAGIALVIGALVALWTYNEDFRKKVMSVWEGIKSFFSVTFEWIKSLVMQVWESLKAFWTKNGEEITQNFKAVWDSISNILMAAFDGLKLIFTVAIALIKGWWALFGDSLLTDLKATFNFITQVLSGAFNIIAGIFNIFIGLFTGNWRKMWDGVKQIAQGAVQVIKGIIDLIIGKIESVISVFKKALSLFSSADTTGKKATEKVQKKAVPTATPKAIAQLKVKKLADGGVVTRPTFAMVGEGGESEAVIPLSKLKNMGFGGGNGITVNITGNYIKDTMDVDIIAEQMAKKLMFAGVR